MSTKAVMSPEAVTQVVTLTLAMPQVNDQTVACYYAIENQQLVVSHGDQVQFQVVIPPALGVKDDQVATYITFTGTNSLQFSTQDPIPWPFLPSEKDKETGYQIVLQAGQASRKYTVAQDGSRDFKPVTYGYRVTVKVQGEPVAPLMAAGRSFYEFHQDPEIYVDEC